MTHKRLKMDPDKLELKKKKRETTTCPIHNRGQVCCGRLLRKKGKKGPAQSFQSRGSMSAQKGGRKRGKGREYAKGEEKNFPTH